MSNLCKILYFFQPLTFNAAWLVWVVPQIYLTGMIFPNGKWMHYLCWSSKNVFKSRSSIILILKTSTALIWTSHLFLFNLSLVFFSHEYLWIYTSIFVFPLKVKVECGMDEMWNNPGLENEYRVSFCSQDNEITLTENIGRLVCLGIACRQKTI